MNKKEIELFKSLCSFKEKNLEKYKENMKILNYESLKFEDLVYKINNNKRTYAYFEDINQNNMFYYKCIIDYIN